ncbi:MAG: hypothetical protein KJP16_02155 [Gammaproteobacteria bacterium]|nr:hypothetical protein [Gammaproteobacteria bacterium]NNL49592.1 hypothetical protein [Woeseiaceae bacterium]
MTAKSRIDKKVAAVAARNTEPVLRKALLLRVADLRHVYRAPAVFVMVLALVGISYSLDTPILTAVMIAYLFGIMTYLAARHEKEFDNLRRILDVSDIVADKVRHTFRHHSRAGLLMTWVVGIGLMIATNFSGPGLTGFREGGQLTVSLVWGLLLAALFWVLACQMMLITYKNSRTFGKLGKDLTKIDLLDGPSLVPFARVGIRNLLIYFGAYTLLPLVLFDGAVYLPALLISLIVTLPFAFLILLLPIIPVHEHVKREKRAELDRIQRAMHGDLAALDDSPIGMDTSDVGFTDLLLYRQMIQGVREWPVNTPVIARLAVYIVIPLLTWFGAAIVEHLVAQYMS